MTPEEREAKRKQYNSVWRYMADGRWHTLAEIADTVDAPTQSISARLRDFRKKRHGAHTVHRFQISETPRVFTYMLERNKDGSSDL